MGLDDIGHLGAVSWVLEVGSSVHPSILEVLPNNILEAADQVITWLEGDLVSSSAEVVAFLGAVGWDRCACLGEQRSYPNLSRYG